MSDKPAGTLGILDRVLTFIGDKPWKAGVILIFAVLGFVGFVLYQERALIADAVLHAPVTRPRLAVQAFIAGHERLLRETKADVAVLAELHLEDNVAIDRIGFDRDGNRWVPVDGPQPALHPATPMSIVIGFLKNEVVCAETQGAAGAEGQALFAAGLRRMCLVAVPPILGTSVGGLLVAWKTPLSPDGEARAGIVLSAAAMKFATW